MSKYWQDRWARSQEILTNKSIKAIEKQLVKYYSRTMKRVMRDFESTYDKLLATVENGKEPTPADLYKLDSYWKMQSQLRDELQKLGEHEIALLSREFENQWFDIYNSIALPSQKSFSTISKIAVTQMINNVWAADGETWSQRVWKNTKKLAETLNEELINCVVTGRTTTYLKEKLQERFNVSYSNADMLVRTETAHIQTQAAKQRYEDAGITKVEIWASKDERRCEVCGKLHKTIYPAGGKIPIPAHPNCRCTILPVIE